MPSQYSVHLYPTIRVKFEDIWAENPEAAFAEARDRYAALCQTAEPIRVAGAAEAEDIGHPLDEALVDTIGADGGLDDELSFGRERPRLNDRELEAVIIGLRMLQHRTEMGHMEATVASQEPLSATEIEALCKRLA